MVGLRRRERARCWYRSAPQRRSTGTSLRASGGISTGAMLQQLDEAQNSNLASANLTPKDGFAQHHNSIVFQLHLTAATPVKAANKVPFVKRVERAQRAKQRATMSCREVRRVLEQLLQLFVLL